MSPLRVLEPIARAELLTLERGDELYFDSRLSQPHGRFVVADYPVPFGAGEDFLPRVSTALLKATQAAIDILGGEVVALYRPNRFDELRKRG